MLLISDLFFENSFSFFERQCYTDKHKERETEREGGRKGGKKRISIFWFILQMVARAGLGNAIARSLEFHLGLPHVQQGPRCWAISFCFFRHISRKVESKVEQMGHELVSIRDIYIADSA